MTMHYLRVAVLAAVCCLCSCAHEKANPVIRDSVWYGGIFRDTTDVFSLTAERRMVVLRTTKNDSGKGSDTRYCAEPPPDVAESLTSALRIALEANLKQQSQGEAAGKVDIEKFLSTDVIQLYQRAHAVQYMRDGLAALCQAYLNGALTSEDYKCELQKHMAKSAELLQAEITQGGAKPGTGKTGGAAGDTNKAPAKCQGSEACQSTPQK